MNASRKCVAHQSMVQRTPRGRLQRRVAIEDTLLEQEKHGAEEALQTKKDISKHWVLFVSGLTVHHACDRRATHGASDPCAHHDTAERPHRQPAQKQNT